MDSLDSRVGQNTGFAQFPTHAGSLFATKWDPRVGVITAIHPDS